MPSSISDRRTTTGLRAMLALGLLAGVATGCAPKPTPVGPTDTGNMAYPAPLPQGQVSTTTVGGPNRPTDTGNMAFPAPLPQGQVSTTRPTGPRRPTDTGNMAFPTPLPQGTVGTTRTTP